MAIDRLKNPFGSAQIVSGLAPENWAYASSTPGAQTAYTFTGDGTAGTVNGGTYRVHRWDYSPTQTGWGITFSQAGIVDLLLCGGGAGGRGSYRCGGGGGGGGAGGLILQFDYGVTATTYSVEVGVGGQYQGQGDDYYNNTNMIPGDSVFGSLTALAGGRAGLAYTTPGTGYSGGSGGGGAGGSTHSTAGSPGGAGTAPQGNSGGRGAGAGAPYGAGGGGGYISQGGDHHPTSYSGGDGGDGIANYKFDGVARGYAAGGGGASYSNGTGGSGGVGGGGNGGSSSGQPGGDATGVGCGGGGVNGTTLNIHGGVGTHGMVIIRYRIG